MPLLRLSYHSHVQRLGAGIARGSAFICQHPWLLAVLVAAAYGVRVNDVTELLAAAADPFRMVLPPERQFLYGSPLPLFISSYYLHNAVPPGAAYTWLQLFGAIVFLVALGRRIGRGLSPSERNIALTVLLASPLLVNALFWIGKTDLFLIGGYLLLSTSEDDASQILLAVLMLLCHAEMGSVLLLLQLLLTPGRWRPIVAGLVLGHVLARGYAFLLTPSPASRLDFALANARTFVSAFFATPVLHLLATFGAFWIYFVTPPIRPAHVAVFLAALGLAIVAQDFTRVFTILSVPALIEISRTVAATRPSRVAWLWPLAFVQVHLAGTNILWAHGIDIRLAN